MKRVQKGHLSLSDDLLCRDGSKGAAREGSGPDCCSVRSCRGRLHSRSPFAMFDVQRLGFLSWFFLKSFECRLKVMVVRVAPCLAIVCGVSSCGHPDGGGSPIGMVATRAEILCFRDFDGELDVLVVDMPPSSGDAQISIPQQLQLSEAVIVSTPQDIAVTDAQRDANIFGKVRVPLLGLIENMSYFKCPHWGGNPIFLDVETIVVSSLDSEAARIYESLASKILEKLKEQQSTSSQSPSIT
ncbi:hypothetical protein L7F22_042954 [Adiantum nelumboides]|nr:hypothetical protein [Adiantum nelumboides]